MWTNKIKSEYSIRKQRMKNMFPEAYDFLTQIESLTYLGFHLGTSTNLHLYYKEYFLTYIILDPPIRFYISPNFNERLKSESPNNNPNKFFIPFQKEMKKHNLHPEYEEGILRIRANGDAKLYFDCCYSALAEIANTDIETIKGVHSKWDV